jgi:sugar phosphate isomerase/epimerase
MPSIDRFGFNASRTRSLEDTLRWAVTQRFFGVDFNADAPPNGLDGFDEARVQQVRDLCQKQGIRLAIHTSSAVNNAEVAPYVSEAVDDYLRENVRLAKRLGCAGVIVHGGYHFTDVARRRQAAVERLQRLAEFAASEQVPLWLENHNTEPEHAEIHYIPDNVEELRWFLEAPGLAESPWLQWTFNVGHAELVPDKTQGFLDAFGVERCVQVRLTDNPGTYEKHVVPGEGVIDFPDVFRRLDRAGYTGPFCLDFGTDADKVRIRDEWLRL